ncbi:hypothetical protein [Naasia sp. SYSU D00948]|uniref:hypothetical protein n=1 Tax=Naasia sp. SYSU D00948 TaxID=2817379 RepID=UPI001B317616|nr:hypothetical protein [Naasia sp. SYSU D00948]
MNTTAAPRPRLLAVAAIAGAALLLSACSTPGRAADPVADEPVVPVEVPVEEAPDEPVEDPEEVPSGVAELWLSGLTGFADSLQATLGEWDAEACSVEAAIDGKGVCTGALTSAAMVSATIDELFASVEDQGFTADELDALAPVQEAAAAAATATGAWTDAECDWEATPDCTGAAEDVLVTTTSLRDALEVWAA